VLLLPNRMPADVWDGFGSPIEDGLKQDEDLGLNSFMPSVTCWYADWFFQQIQTDQKVHPSNFGGILTCDAASTKLLARTSTLANCEPTIPHAQPSVNVDDNRCTIGFAIVSHEAHLTRATKHRLVILHTFVIPDGARKFLEEFHPMPSIPISLHLLFLIRSQYLTFNTCSIGMFL
jgi:hypothetical protein